MVFYYWLILKTKSIESQSMEELLWLLKLMLRSRSLGFSNLAGDISLEEYLFMEELL